MTLTDLLYAGKGERVGKWWLAQCAHGVDMLKYTSLHASRDAYNKLLQSVSWSTSDASYKRINIHTLINLHYYS